MRAQRAPVTARVPGKCAVTNRMCPWKMCGYKPHVSLENVQLQTARVPGKCAVTNRTYDSVSLVNPCGSPVGAIEPQILKYIGLTQ